MKNILYAMLATASGLVLLFSYRTSLGDSVPLEPATTATTDVAPSPAPAGRDTQSTGSSSAGGYADGTYTGSTIRTRYGDVQVVVTMANGTISSVDVPVYPDGNGTDRRISARALPMLVDETISAQSGSIHLISGATYTSRGYVQSLQSALDQAAR